MDVDTSFNFAPSSSAPDQGPLSAAPTITAFNFGGPSSFGPSSPISAAPTVTTFNNLFYEVPSPNPVGHGLEEAANISGVSSFTESPCQPFPKKRRSSSPDPKSVSLRSSHQLFCRVSTDEDGFFQSWPLPTQGLCQLVQRHTECQLSLLSQAERFSPVPKFPNSTCP